MTLFLDNAFLDREVHERALRMAIRQVFPEGVTVTAEALQEIDGLTTVPYESDQLVIAALRAQGAEVSPVVDAALHPIDVDWRTQEQEHRAAMREYGKRRNAARRAVVLQLAGGAA